MNKKTLHYTGFKDSTMSVPLLGDKVFILAPEGECWGTITNWPKGTDWIWVSYAKGHMLMHSARLIPLSEGRWEDRASKQAK